MRMARTAALAAGGAALVLLPLAVSEHVLTVAISTLLLAYMSLSWNLVAGYAGQLSLGHAVFFGVGAYTSTVLLVDYQLTPWVGMWVGAALAMAVGALFAAVAFRYRIGGVFFALITLASMEVFKSVADNLAFLRGPVGILLPLENSPARMLFFDRWPYYYIILTMTLGLMVLTAWLERTRLGLSMVAVREDEAAAAASGIDTYRVKVLVMAISAGLTALGGTFYAQFYLYIAPPIAFGFEHQLNMMLGTFVGGAGTVIGPALGSALFSLLGEALRSVAASREVATITKMVYAVVLAAIVIYRPGGLMSLWGRRRRPPVSTAAPTEAPSQAPAPGQAAPRSNAPGEAWDVRAS